MFVPAKLLYLVVYLVEGLLHGSHAARHAEGRGDGREDRDGGLNDEAPYLSFLFIHDFSFR